MQGPHTSPIVVVSTPEVFLAFEGLHKRIVLLAVIILGGFVLPCPLVRGLLLRGIFCLLLVLRFLGHWFLFLHCGLAVLVHRALMFLFQRVDFSCHGYNLLLFLGRLSPCVFLVQESCFVFVFGADHEVLRCVSCPVIVGLTPEVLDVYDKFFVRGCLIGLPQVVEEINCFLLPGMKAAHLFSDPLNELSDVAL